jgi:hypothetical protein
MGKVYVLIKQIYDEFDIIGVCSSKTGAENLLEQERICMEENHPGCWEEGGFKEMQDWTYGGIYVKVRNGEAFKHWYHIEEYDLLS